MEELIKRLKEITSLPDLKNLNDINRNQLLFAISKSDRYDLLKDADIRIDCDDSESFEKIIDYFLSDEDYLYYMHKNGFSFSKGELDKIFNVMCKKYYGTYRFDYFFRDFFSNKEELDIFVREHKPFFEKYIQTIDGNPQYDLRKCDSFVEMVLNSNNAKLIYEIENYSLPNLKLLANFLKHHNIDSPYLGNDRFAYKLFELKSDFSPDEFCTLLGLFQESNQYDRKVRNSELGSFSILIKDNLDFLIDVVSQTKVLPKCLMVSNLFRDECLKKRRIGLASKCLFSPDIVKDGELIKLYCDELNISLKDFYDRYKWLLSYYEKNKNVFNTFLGTSFNDGIFNLNEEHFERFINDIDVQMLLSKLNSKELLVLSKILDAYNYKDYDISYFVVSILKNISDYSGLINSLNLNAITSEDVKLLVAVLQISGNPYKINNVNELRNYSDLKRKYFEESVTDDLDFKKDSILMALFNVTLKEAIYIDSKYSRDKRNNSVLDSLDGSELPKEIYDYLVLISKIVDSKSSDELNEIYRNLNTKSVYNKEIPLEAYLRSVYTKLYSDSLFKINEKENVYGPNDSIFYIANYGDKDVKVCIPRMSFNFFVHCVGSCSLDSDVIDANYRNDWMDRPQIEDHFVACSYINERGIYSIRAENSIIFGFDNLEGGSILAMGNTDIDSIGTYSKSYNGSRELQEGSHTTKCFVPSEILKSVNEGYNEIVVERRNTDKSKSNDFKRKPDYIIMMADSVERGSLKYLDTILDNDLSFVSEFDKASIKQNKNKMGLRGIFAKYSDVVTQLASEWGISYDDLVSKYINMISEAKYFEDCLKASSEFDIPLVVVDKTYYFNKILSESKAYDDETKKFISTFYSKANGSVKRQVYNKVATGGDIGSLVKPKKVSL